MPRKVAAKKSSSKSTTVDSKKKRSSSSDSDDSEHSNPRRGPKFEEFTEEDALIIDQQQPSASTTSPKVMSNMVTPEPETFVGDAPKTNNDTESPQGDAQDKQVAACDMGFTAPDSIAPEEVVPVPEEECVPLAAVEAVYVNRAQEAINGLLKEPAPPPKDIKRVTQDGETSPPLPIELLQLLSEGCQR
ncbi:unnamed protein product [Phytomonas sp. EM1]|nr:unnamed protein product [Phytomonas sp. EM1]|eukprot:CCW60028.1 unnamed protein product [Phytomonas sp. isolate EM1]